MVKKAASKKPVVKKATKVAKPKITIPVDITPDASINFSITDGSISITTDASGIDESNFHLLPLFFDKVYSREMKDACVASTINKVNSVEAKTLLFEQLLPSDVEKRQKEILWDSAESYRIESLTSEEVQQLKEEMDLDDDDDVELIGEDDGPEVMERELEIRIGYANFDIAPYASVIQKCDGVDNFQQLSRYRFVIHIGKHWFNFTDVRKKLTKLLKLKESGV